MRASARTTAGEKPGGRGFGGGEGGESAAGLGTMKGGGDAYTGGGGLDAYTGRGRVDAFTGGVGGDAYTGGGVDGGEARVK